MYDRPAYHLRKYDFNLRVGLLSGFEKEKLITENLKNMKIYIASSWKNQHAVEMLTALLRASGHEVISFVEKNFDELKIIQKVGFDEWINSEDGAKAFCYDTDGATKSDLVIYIAPSGKDAAAEVGAAWGSGIPIIALWAKGEDFGLMRRMVSSWHYNYRELLDAVLFWNRQFIIKTDK